MPEQVIVENGRVTGLFKAINSMALLIFGSLLLWAGVTLTELNAQVAVLISQNETRISEHAAIDRRITENERHRRDGHGLDSRDK